MFKRELYDLTGTILFNLIIAPLEFLFEFVFTVGIRILNNPLAAIICLSLVVNFLALPLYKRADVIWREENEKQAKMAPWVKHIKNTFRGDERYLMLNAYYRQENYKTFHSLRGSISLLLQIPFFIAAYHFLSNLELLKGMSVWIFKDLGAPDGLLSMGGLQINLLPIVMTAFNVISSYIYLKNSSISQKIQTYALAAVFLLILYSSPSGLVIYWTCNQIFSLVKNIVMTGVLKRKKNFIYMKAGTESQNAPKSDTKVFVLITLFLALFWGAAIPFSVISSSPAEFAASGRNPFETVLFNFCAMAGVFMVWCGVYYYLGTPKMRKIFTYVLFAVSVVSALNFFFFANNRGVLSESLVYDGGLSFENIEIIMNIAAVILSAAAAAALSAVFKKYMKYAVTVLCMAAVGFIITHGIITASELSPEDFKRKIAADDVKPAFTLSKTGKNVAVLMLDRAISAYVPFILNEFPKLQNEYKDFTYYPNTLAYAGHTNFAAPSIYGGYEYTPAAINSRPYETLKDKHNEALFMMPKILGEQGFKVTIIDPPYPGYEQKGDISVYDGMENVTAVKMAGRYECPGTEDMYKEKQKIQGRNFFYYSFMKAAPVFLQSFIYDGGNYFSKNENYYSSDAFVDSYAVLKNLSKFSQIKESSENTFLMMDNETTHSATILNEDYEPGAVLKDSVFERPGTEETGGRVMKMDTWSRISHYEANAAACIQLAEWFKWLKKNNLWDNTKIIIVSDHGYGWEQFDDLIINDSIDLQRYNALLMVKDFKDSNELMKTDRTFMTTADVPTLALAGITENPVNPFTGKAISSDEKNKEPQLVTTSKHYRPNSDNPNGHTFDTSDGEWWKVHSNIFDANNWEFAGYGS